jgi:hypothetical protein
MITRTSKRYPLFRGLGTCLLAAGRQAFSARFRDAMGAEKDCPKSELYYL